MEKSHVELATEAHEENIGRCNVPVDLIIEGAGHHEKSALEKRLVRKSDMVIMPLAALAYFASYLDRNCIGNAKVMGLAKDLDLSGNQFYNCVTMVFVGYIIMILPANMLSRKFKPNRCIGGAVIFFGAMLTALFGAKNYATVVSLRLLIGCGASFVPTLTLYTSLYYARDELATRNAIYYATATTSGAFSGVIAFGIQSSMTYEATGHRPWQWLFLILGVIGMGIGLMIIIFLPRYPDDLHVTGKKHWLFTPEEIACAAERTQSYNQRGAKVEWKQLLATAKDPKTYMYAMCQSASVLGVGVVGSFLPIFINDFGYSPLTTQLFTIIPYACSFLSVLFAGIMSDRLNKKGVFLLGGYGMGCVGYIMLLAQTNSVASMVAACLITMAGYTAVVLLPVWIAINTAGFTKRSATWATAEITGLSFSVMGTRIYTDPPRNIKGHSIVLAFYVVAFTTAIVLMWFMHRENKMKDRELQQYADRNEVHPHIANGVTLEEAQDKHISFRYIL